MKLGILVNTDRHLKVEIAGLTHAALAKGHEVAIFAMDEGHAAAHRLPGTSACRRASGGDPERLPAQRRGARCERRGVAAGGPLRQPAAERDDAARGRPGGRIVTVRRGANSACGPGWGPRVGAARAADEGIAICCATDRRRRRAGSSPCTQRAPGEGDRSRHTRSLTRTWWTRNIRARQGHMLVKDGILMPQAISRVAD